MNSCARKVSLAHGEGALLQADRRNGIKGYERREEGGDFVRENLGRRQKIIA